MCCMQYIFSRAILADLLCFLVWLAYLAILQPGILALSTFHPFHSTTPVLTGAALLSVAMSFALAWHTGLRRRLLTAFGYAAEEAELSFGPLRLKRCRRVGQPGGLNAKSLAGVLLAGIAAAGLSAGMIGLTHWGWHVRFDKLGRSASEAGLPVTLAGFSETLPPDAYAFAVLESELESLNGDLLMSAPQQRTALRKWDRAMYAKSLETVSGHEDFIAGLTAINGRFCRFRPIDYSAASRDPDAIPDFASEKYFQLARLLRLQALTSAYRGDFGSAWAKLEKLLDLAGLLAADRALEVKLAALSLRGQAVEAAITAMFNAPGQPVPDRLAGRLKAIQAERLVRDGVRYELARRLDFRRAYELPVITGRKKMVKFHRHEAEPHFSEEDLLNLGARLLTLAGAFDAGYYKLASYLANEGQDETRAASRVSYCESWPVWPYRIAQFEWPQYGGFYLKEREFKAWARLALVASALERYRLSSGTYPASLGALSPRYLEAEYLSDPFSNWDFNYAPAGGGYALCSAGPSGDGKNSDGQHFCATQSSSPKHR